MNNKEFIQKYEELLNSGYCECNELNCLDNNSPRKILNIMKEQLEDIERLNKALEETQQSYTDEYNLRHKLSLELSIEKDKTLELSNHLSMYSSEETMLKEIERLNNIIKNLDKMFEFYFLGNSKYDQDTVNTIYIKYVKLKELKENKYEEVI